MESDCFDVHSEQEESDGADSDQIDSDVEAKLYSLVYHAAEDKDDSLCLADATTGIHSVPSEPPVAGSSSNRTKIDIITISSGTDSEEGYDSEPSKSRLMAGGQGLKRKRPVEEQPDCPFLSSDESDDEISFIPIDDSDIRVPSIQTLASDDKNSALSNFIDKCRPGSDPQATDQTESSVEPSPRPVSLSLLNSLPGSSNRFKRIRLDPGEDPLLWCISAEDEQLQRQKRYFAGSRKQTACLNCKKFTDHLARDCPYPRQRQVCFICGAFGHSGHRCYKVICGKCFGNGHSSTECQKVGPKTFCNECDRVGHSNSDCPNHWRRFCLTVSFDQNAIPHPQVERNRRVSCSNCSSASHFVFDCPERGSDMYPLANPLFERKSQHSSKKRNKSTERQSQNPSTSSTPSTSTATPTIEANSRGNSTSKKKRKKKKKSKSPQVNSEFEAVSYENEMANMWNDTDHPLLSPTGQRAPSNDLPPETKSPEPSTSSGKKKKKKSKTSPPAQKAKAKVKAKAKASPKNSKTGTKKTGVPVQSAASPAVNKKNQKQPKLKPKLPERNFKKMAERVSDLRMNEAVHNARLAMNQRSRSASVTTTNRTVQQPQDQMSWRDVWNQPSGSQPANQMRKTKSLSSSRFPKF